MNGVKTDRFVIWNTISFMVIIHKYEEDLKENFFKIWNDADSDKYKNLGCSGVTRLQLKIKNLFEFCKMMILTIQFSGVGCILFLWQNVCNLTVLQKHFCFKTIPSFTALLDLNTISSMKRKISYWEFQSLSKQSS